MSKKHGMFGSYNYPLELHRESRMNHTAHHGAIKLVNELNRQSIRK